MLTPRLAPSAGRGVHPDGFCAGLVLPDPAAPRRRTPHPPSADVHPAAGAPPAAEDTSAAAQAFDAVLAEPSGDYRQRLRLAQAAAGLDRTEIVAALEREHARDPVSLGQHTLPTEALLARFAELDPAAATLWLVQTYPPGRILPDWLSVTLETWASTDLKAALAWAQGLPPGALRGRVVDEVLEQLATTDPAGAVQRLSLLDKAYNYSVTAVFAKWAEKDLSAACAGIAQLPPDRQNNAVQGIVGVWVMHQPAEAYAWAAQVPPGNPRDNVIRQLYTTWGEQDPATAGAWLVAHGGPDVGKYASNLAAQWAALDVNAARAWSESLPPHDRRNALDSVLSVWSGTDPQAVMQYALTLPERQRESTLANTIAQWANKDRAAALAWTEQSASSGDLRENALSAVCGNWASEDPRACADYLARLPDDAARQQLSGTLDSWARQSSEEVWRWGQGQADAKTRTLAAAAALTAQAANDPAGASARLTQLPPEAQPDAAGKVAEQWVAIDPDAAGRWSAALPGAEARAAAVQAVAGAWAQDDATHAAAWLDAQAPGDARDKGINAMLTSVPDGLEPAASAQLASSIQDTDTRHGALTNVAEGWLHQDRAAALAWIAQSPEFTPEERTQLTQRESDAPQPVVEKSMVFP